MTNIVSSPRSPFWLNRVAVVISLIFVLCLPLLASNFKRDRDPHRDGPLAGDFAQEYLGAYIILHGDYQHFYDLEYAFSLEHDPDVMGTVVSEKNFLPMIYPPFYYLLAAPLGLLPFYTAAVVWLYAMATALGVTIWLLAKAYPEHRALWTWGSAGAFLFMPLLEDLHTGQKATVALLILTATYLLLKRKQPFLAGLVFGLLAFKPQLTLVIAFAMLCKLQWRFIAGGMMTGAVLIGLSLLVSPDVCAQYLEVSQSMAAFIDRSGFRMEKMHCWYGFWRLLLPGQPLHMVQIVTVLSSLATVAVLARLLWGPLAFGGRQFARQFAGLVIGTVLLSPHLLTYDLTILLLPFFLLTHLFLNQPSPFAKRDKFLVYSLVILYITAGFSPIGAQLTHVQITVPILVVLLAILASQKDAPVISAEAI